jgi:hypothetical protein
MQESKTGAEQVVVDYYLVVAKFLYDEYKNLDIPEENRDPCKTNERSAEQQNARQKAMELFGVGGGLRQDGSLVFCPNGRSEKKLLNPDPLFSAHNTFLASFPYDFVGEAALPDTLFGWVAIIPAAQLDNLVAKLDCPQSDFCKVFDIHISPIGVPIEGFVSLNLADKSISTEARQYRSVQVYHEQTPAMWAK